MKSWALRLAASATLGRDSGVNRTGVAIVLLVLVALGVALYAAFRTRTATLRWDYDYQKDPPCNDAAAASTQQKSCVLGFKVFLGTPASRSDQQFVPNRFDQNGEIISKRITWTIPARPYGNIQLCVVAVAPAENGRTAESVPLCVTQRVLPFGIGRK